MPDRKEIIDAIDAMTDEERSELLEQIVHDPRAKRRAGVRGWWYRYAGSVAFGLLILISAGGFFAIDDTADEVAQFAVDLRNGLVNSCEQNGNPLREFVIEQAREKIHQSHETDYSVFFPNVDPQVLHDAIHAQNQRTFRLLQTIQPVDCEALYPEPHE